MICYREESDHHHFYILLSKHEMKKKVTIPTKLMPHKITTPVKNNFNVFFWYWITETQIEDWTIPFSNTTFQGRSLFSNNKPEKQRCSNITNVVLSDPSALPGISLTLYFSKWGKKRNLQSWSQHCSLLLLVFILFVQIIVVLAGSAWQTSTFQLRYD